MNWWKQQDTCIGRRGRGEREDTRRRWGKREGGEGGHKEKEGKEGRGRGDQL